MSTGQEVTTVESRGSRQLLPLENDPSQTATKSWIALADPTGSGGAMAPLATWASAQNALKVAIFRLKIETFSGEGAMPASFPLHKSQRSFQHVCFAA